MVFSSVSVMSPCVLAARWSSTARMRAPLPTLGLSIIR
jgi:hypothetical protein